MADPALDLLREHVEHAHRRALAAGAGGRRDGDERREGVYRRGPLSNRGVDVVEHLARVAVQQVDRLGGVDRRPTADRHERVPGTTVSSEVDRLDQARIGRLDVRPVEQSRLDADRLDLLDDPLRMPGGRDARVGDHQHPMDAVRREVVADLVRGTGPELQLWGTVGEDGLVVAGWDHAGSLLPLYCLDCRGIRTPWPSSAHSGWR